MTRSVSAPVLTKLSPYECAPKFSIAQKRQLKDRANDCPASNKYDIRNLVDKTSKFSQLTRSCSFGAASRFPKSKIDGVGPGGYNTATSTLSGLTSGFGTSRRPPINGVSKKTPGPGQYTAQRDKHGQTTLTEISCSVGARVGWFYDDREAGMKPGPGSYQPNHTQVETPAPKVAVGTSNRPSIASHLGVDSKNVIGPGQYSIATTVGGNIETTKPPSYSFTQASDRTKVKKLKDDPPLVLQVTQFGIAA